MITIIKIGYFRTYSGTTGAFQGEINCCRELVVERAQPVLYLVKTMGWVFLCVLVTMVAHTCLS